MFENAARKGFPPLLCAGINLARASNVVVTSKLIYCNDGGALRGSVLVKKTAGRERKAL
jgi:hypothetical protein